MIILIDTNILGKLCYTKSLNTPDLDLFENALLTGNYRFIVPEISDYELRRKFLHNSQKTPPALPGVAAISKLDILKMRLGYLALTTSIMQDAASLWARCRVHNHQFARDEALDGDVILAAQARSINATVLTDNTKHLSFLVPTKTLSQL